MFVIGVNSGGHVAETIHDSGVAIRVAKNALMTSQPTLCRVAKLQPYPFIDLQQCDPVDLPGMA